MKLLLVNMSINPRLGGMLHTWTHLFWISTNDNCLAVSTHLKHICQLGFGKIKFMFQTTNEIRLHNLEMVAAVTGEGWFQP
jgi:hypothetical protein